MQDFAASFWLAGRLVVTADAVLLEIIGLSLSVSLIAVVVACALGFPLGALVAIGRFRGRQAIVIVLNSLMGLPPVVVGLLVYMMLSNAGPLGWLELLYTPGAMIIAQAVLVTPIVAALSREVLEQLNAEYAEQFRSLCLPASTVVRALLWDGRYILMTVALAGFGRAIAEVGAVMIVGGNIDHVTRVMTSAIALETSKGNLSTALGLGIVLLFLALAVNAAVQIINTSAGKRAALA